MEDGVVLMYVKDGVVYSVALTQEQHNMLQMTASLFSPLRIVKDQPQGKAINLLDKK